MTGSSHAAFAVGGITIVGGLFAYLKKKSTASLMGSLFLGGGLVAAGLMINNGNEFGGHVMAGLSSFGIANVGAMRYYSSGKPMPAIPLMIIGTLSTYYQYNKAQEWK